MHTEEVSFVGKWKSATAGESLLHFLATEVTELRIIDSTARDLFSGVSRSQAISSFLHGVVILHVFGRILQAAKAYRSKHLDDENTCLLLIETFVVDKLNITRSTCQNFSSLAPLALNAARMSRKNSHTISQGKRREIQNEFKNEFRCYSCGCELDPYETRKEVSHPQKPWRKIPNHRFAEYEHIWPHSFGGDTVIENLAPVCLPCNDAKENYASWEWMQIQSLLPNAELGREILESKHTSRAIKISLHMKAAMHYAKKHGTTLKGALRTIGPREENVMVIDVDDTADYFNLRVHDELRTGIRWEA
jgi:hypothetical protein